MAGKAALADKTEKTTDEAGAVVADGDSTTKVKDVSGEAGAVVADDAAESDWVETITVATRIDGFRRAGREWVGTTTVAASEFTAEQLEMLVNEKNLVVVVD